MRQEPAEEHVKREEPIEKDGKKKNKLGQLCLTEHLILLNRH